MLGEKSSKTEGNEVKAEMITVTNKDGSDIREFDSLKDAELWVAEHEGYEIVPEATEE